MAYDEITKPMTVTELNEALNTLLSEAFYQIIVIGEISGYKRTTTGHWYFDLKDRDAAISCAVWRGLQGRMPNIKDGDLVIAHGQISLYQKTGKITFAITRMELKGDGDLKALIEKRKQYYQSLGWFDPADKKNIPDEIHKLGVVTSATGAAFQDILNITRRRAPGLDIILFPATVQGNGAGIEIASRIRQANNFEACDVLIVGRGGGSEEDLSCFSEDEVIIAIHESKIPIISAVGHEIDFPLSDYVSDLRAPTPSAAAELVTETIYKRTTRLNNSMMMINAIMMEKLTRIKASIEKPETLKGFIVNKLLKAKSQIKGTGEAKAILKGKIRNAEIGIMHSQESIETAIDDKISNNLLAIERLKKESALKIKDKAINTSIELKEIRSDLRYLANKKVSFASSELQSMKKEIEALSPLAVLSRGYAIVTDEKGNAIKSKKKIYDKEKLSIRVSDGSFAVRVEE